MLQQVRQQRACQLRTVKLYYYSVPVGQWGLHRDCAQAAHSHLFRLELPLLWVKSRDKLATISHPKHDLQKRPASTPPSVEAQTGQGSRQAHPLPTAGAVPLDHPMHALTLRAPSPSPDKALHEDQIAGMGVAVHRTIELGGELTQCI